MGFFIVYALPENSTDFETALKQLGRFQRLDVSVYLLRTSHDVAQIVLAIVPHLAAETPWHFVCELKKIWQGTGPWLPGIVSLMEDS